MYGAQTSICRTVRLCLFENDVEMYGAQTIYWCSELSEKFENDVEMYGAQTPHFHVVYLSLVLEYK